QPAAHPRQRARGQRVDRTRRPVPQPRRHGQRPALGRPPHRLTPSSPPRADLPSKEHTMSFLISLSGMNAASADLNITSNNIANANSTGFKQSRGEFGDVFAATAHGLSNNTIGAGVRLQR